MLLPDISSIIFDYVAPPKDAVPTCKQAGVIGAMGGVIGSLQAMEAIKYILGVGDLLTGYLLTYDALKMGTLQLTWGFVSHIIMLSRAWLSSDPQNRKRKKSRKCDYAHYHAHCGRINPHYVVWEPNDAGIFCLRFYRHGQ